MLYGAECWPVRRREEQIIHVAEMRMLRRSCGVTLMDRRTKESIRTEMKTIDIIEKLRERRLSWWGHVGLHRRDDTTLLKRVRNLEVPGRRARGRPKLTLARKVRSDMTCLGLQDDDALDRSAWKHRCRAADPP